MRKKLQSQEIKEEEGLMMGTQLWAHPPLHTFHILLYEQMQPTR